MRGPLRGDQPAPAPTVRSSSSISRPLPGQPPLVPTKAPSQRPVGFSSASQGGSPHSDNTPSSRGLFPAPSSKPPQRWRKLPSSMKWRQGLMLGRGLNPENHRLTIMDGGKDMGVLNHRGRGESYHLLPDLKVTGIASIPLNPECSRAQVVSRAASGRLPPPQPRLPHLIVCNRVLSLPAAACPGGLFLWCLHKTHSALVSRGGSSAISALLLPPPGSPHSGGGLRTQQPRGASVSPLSEINQRN